MPHSSAAEAPRSGIEYSSDKLVLLAIDCQLVPLSCLILPMMLRSKRISEISLYPIILKTNLHLRLLFI